MKFEPLFRNWKHIEEYELGQVIFSRRDRADAMYVILSGEVELKLNGKLLGVETEGGLIGITAMLDSATRSLTARARAQTRLARVDREQLQELVGRDREFAMHVMGALASRLRAVDSFISTHLERES